MTHDSLKMLTRARGLSRREFIQQAIAAGIAVSAAEGMFAAMARAEPKKGGRFRLALGSGSTTDSLDPGNIPDTFNQVVAWALPAVEPDRRHAGGESRSRCCRKFRILLRCEAMGVQTAQRRRIPQWQEP